MARSKSAIQRLYYSLRVVDSLSAFSLVSIVLDTRTGSGSLNIDSRNRSSSNREREKRISIGSLDKVSIFDFCV